MEKFMQCMKDHDGIHLHCHQQTKVKLLLLFKHRLFVNPISFRIRIIWPAEWKKIS
jgi:hypothetical protein